MGIVLDLEWNGAYSRKAHGYFNEIIEIGAVKMEDGVRQTDTFHAVMRPVVSRKLSPLVHDLTGIEANELEEGIPFAQAVSRFRKWMGGEDAVLMTWSTTDLLVLLENCRYFLQTERIPFMRRYADLQAYCQKRLDCPLSRQLGLNAAAELLGLTADGLDLHRALDDSILSGRIFARLYDREAFAREVRSADAEFYGRLLFKTVTVSDMNSPYVRLEEEHFDCPDCGRPLQRSSDWRFRGRAFCADYDCPDCGGRYAGRVQVRLKYDGPETRRRLTPRRDPAGDDVQETAPAAPENAAGPPEI